MPNERVAAERYAVLLATDAGFALPTAACALQIRRRCVPSDYKIHVVTTGIEADKVKQLQDFLGADGIEVNNMPQSLFMDFDPQFFNVTHVPNSTLARFFLLDCVPATYDRILYLDGDTWPQGDLSSLMTADLPADHFAAAEDMSYYLQYEPGRYGRGVTDYFHGLGINGVQGYFNAGVLLAGTATFKTICKDAFTYFRSNTARCLYHDQSALNAVAAGRRVRLAPRWNFLSVYPEWGIRKPAASCIHHFAGGEKPWLYPNDPFAEIFNSAFSELAGLPFKADRLPPQRLPKALRAQKLRRAKNQTIFRHRLRARRRIFKSLEQAASIA